MKRIIISAILGVFVATMSAPFAMAADIIEVDDRVPAPYHEGGWYLRGDIGYVIPEDPVVVYGNGVVPFVNENLGGAWMIGAGIGYQFNPSFRADITVDFRTDSTFTGGTVCGGCGGALSVERQKLSTTTVMFNAYWDMGECGGFTPYIGGGVGFAYNWLHDIIGRNPTMTVTWVPDGGKWNFAAAVMAGATFDVTEDLKIDAGYRYIWLGDAESGTDGAGGTVSYTDLANHEIRLGMRRYF
jgi:opacity protein-like surface antigen